jgi:uncharacterized protein YdcH (DUF465 family)
MSHIPQDLHDIFPADAELLRTLKATDRHFQALAARYGELDAAVHAIVTGEDPATDARAEEAKKARLAVLDEIAAALAARRAA